MTAIKTSKAYVTSDGLAFPNLALAKIHELELLCKGIDVSVESIARHLVQNEVKVIEILRQRERKPRVTKTPKKASTKRAKKPASNTLVASTAVV